MAPTVLFGWAAPAQMNSSSLQLAAAATWLAFSFVARTAKTLNTVRLFLSAKAGAPITSDLTCDLFSDNNGIPNVSIEGPKSAGSVPAANNWVQWSGFTTALSAGTQYWLVFKNANGTPGTNNPTYQWAGVGSNAAPVSLSLGQLDNAALFFGFGKVHSTNSGTAWATSPQSVVAGPRLGYSDSTFDGLPAQSSTRPGSGATGDATFGKQEAGVKFTIPTGCTFNCRGIWMIVGKTGTPGNLAFRIYQGTTLLGTTYAIPAANVSTVNTGDGYYAEFSSPIALTNANSPYRVTMNDATSGDANTSRYNAQLYTWDSDSNSLALKPVNGTLQETVTTDNTAAPPVFTDTSTNVMPFLLVGDTVSGEFTASGGGGGGSILTSSIIQGIPVP